MRKTSSVLVKWIGLVLAIILLASSLAGCGTKEKVLKIGFITEQTGVDAYVGPASVPAMQD